jgi:hypothetical protein
MRKFSTPVIISLLSLTLAVFIGCGDSPIDGHTTPSLVTINGGIPIYSDVWVVDTTLASGGSVPQESALFIFRNTPTHSFLDLAPEDPHGTFIIESYTITYELIQMIAPPQNTFTPGEFESFTASCHLSLPVNSEVETTLLMIPFAMKLDFPIIDLFPENSAPAGELIVRADIVFTGHESGSDKIRTLEGSATIIFANFADEDS